MTTPATSANSDSTAQPKEGWVVSMLRFGEKAAALVYHDILVVQRDFTKLSEQNPAVAQVVQRGVNFAMTLMAAEGLPTREFALVATVVEACLKELAANDPTVQSGPVHVGAAAPGNPAAAGAVAAA